MFQVELLSGLVAPTHFGLRRRSARAVAASLRLIGRQHVAGQLRVIAFPRIKRSVDRVDSQDAAARLLLQRVAKLDDGRGRRNAEKIIEIKVEARIARDVADEALAASAELADDAVIRDRSEARLSPR